MLIFAIEDDVKAKYRALYFYLEIFGDIFVIFWVFHARRAPKGYIFGDWLNLNILRSVGNLNFELQTVIFYECSNSTIYNFPLFDILNMIIFELNKRKWMCTSNSRLLLNM